MASTTASSARRSAAHALDRLAFGPGPGEVERVLDEGLPCWIDRQLAAEDPEDGLQPRLAQCAAALFTISHVVYLTQTSGFALSPSEAALTDMRSAKLIRAVHARNQLAEVLADFWYNHFNVYAYSWQPSVPAYEREAIRPHVLGRFRDLLGAVAAHPAMLYYLDAYVSTVSRLVDGKLRLGFNENYGRELLELHTVGVDAGYTQADVVDAARVFTGWGIEGLVYGEPATFQFCFRAARHDAAGKQVFGLKIPAGLGREEGELLLDYLAAHPATALFVSRRLAERFVSDDPPPGLVRRCASVFESSGGDIRAVLAELFSSDEFRSEAVFGTKAKTPFEFAVSAVRELGCEVRDAVSLAGVMANMGMPLYGCKAPTGYSNRGCDWLNAASQVGKFDFAFQLAAGSVPGIESGAAARSGDAKAAGLRLAGPPFQWR
ncbi:MAG TPA: DUF1800 domain-containing protein [Thermoanaerobaculia bacterium]|nr:DUF1800 domain-containing protein [Thermoanaerobaculia bacterium]